MDDDGGLVSRATVVSLTVSWLGLVVTYGFARFPEMLAMSPVQHAEFAAGVLAPVGIIWLIAGYYQTSQELTLQRRELAAQRTEFERWATSGEAMAAAESMRVRPHFEASGGEYNATYMGIALKVVGTQSCCGLRFPNSVLSGYVDPKFDVDFTGPVDLDVLMTQRMEPGEALTLLIDGHEIPLGRILFNASDVRGTWHEYGLTVYGKYPEEIAQGVLEEAYAVSVNHIRRLSSRREMA